MQVQPLVVDEIGCSVMSGYAISTLQKQRVRGGGIPFVKLGRRVVYRLTDIEAHLAARVVTSTSERVAA